MSQSVSRASTRFELVVRVSFGTWTSPSVTRLSSSFPLNFLTVSHNRTALGALARGGEPRCSAVRPTARYSHRRAVCSVAVSAIRRARRRKIRTSGGTCQSKRPSCLSFGSSTKGARDVILLSLSLSLPLRLRFPLSLTLSRYPSPSIHRKMLGLVCRQALLANTQKVGTRCLGSIVPVSNPPDFPLENEPVLSYKKGSPERAELEKVLDKMSSECEEVPLVIGNEEIKTDLCRYQVMPHNHKEKVAKYYWATPELVKKAINVAVKAQREWEKWPIEKRLEMWLRIADLMATKYRQHLNAATMLGQSKTVIQAEIDSAAELIDFFKMHAYFVKESLKYQPISPNQQTLNSMRYRGMDGFVAAVSPFNFTAIGGNLSYTPALMGNAVLWKPSDTALLSNWWIFKICREAGMPPGVVNFIPCEGPVFGDTITSSPHLSGLNFTGSVPTFNRLWAQIGQNLAKYRNYPKLIGECGGKNYHFVHSSADVETVINATIRSAFEFNGQKCSACSRMYVPESLWSKVKEGLLALRQKLTIGDIRDFTIFTGAVIDAIAFKRISGYIEYAKKSPKMEIIGGGGYDDSCGYFIEPTIVQSKDPKEKLMTEEIFGPVLTIYVYKDSDLDETVKLVETSTPYALTGAIFAQDEKWARKALEDFKYTAGNFYVNDKSTGSVVGQQPFGGSRMSGTNDKAGGPHYALRWASPQAIKETFAPIREYDYPYMRS